MRHNIDVQQADFGITDLAELCPRQMRLALDRLQKMFVIRRILGSLLICTLMLTGCSSVQRCMFWGLTTRYPGEPQDVEPSDGYEATYYSFTKGDQDSEDTFLFLIAGSTHASMAYSCYNLKDLPRHVQVFALQNRYISPRCSPVSRPPDEYYRTHYLSSFCRDQIEFINMMLSREVTIPERVVVFGILAGGTIAGAVPAQAPEITHLIVLGEG